MRPRVISFVFGIMAIAILVYISISIVFPSSIDAQWDKERDFRKSRPLPPLGGSGGVAMVADEKFLYVFTANTLYKVDKEKFEVVKTLTLKPAFEKHMPEPSKDPSKNPWEPKGPTKDDDEEK